MTSSAAAVHPATTASVQPNTYPSTRAATATAPSDQPSGVTTEPALRATRAMARPATEVVRTIHTMASAIAPSRSPTIRARALVSSACVRVTVLVTR